MTMTIIDEHLLVKHEEIYSERTLELIRKCVELVPEETAREIVDLLWPGMERCNGRSNAEVLLGLTAVYTAVINAIEEQNLDDQIDDALRRSNW